MTAATSTPSTWGSVISFDLRPVVAATLVVAAPLAFAAADETVYQEQSAFLASVFAQHVPEPEMLWFTGDLRRQITETLGHPPGVARLRYWRNAAGRSVWVLNEIGKERPITAGIVVEQGRIQLVRILIYRESRGQEVQQRFFTRQFDGAALKDTELDREIDGISGATLSVAAVEKMAQVALLLSQHLKS